jgi:hypothetical protein
MRRIGSLLQAAGMVAAPIGGWFVTPGLGVMIGAGCVFAVGFLIEREAA